MSSDRTQHQSSEEQKAARQLSVEPNRPPAQIPGYKLEKFIGSGAYGEVWTATDLKTSRRVAVKFYTRRSGAGVQQLMREVEKLLAVTSDARYVVQLFDVGWNSDPPYYVMDYIENGSLEERLKSGNRIPASEAIEVFQEVATGMQHLHSKGILHCDLKPGNVLLDQDNNPRVADFGQSRLKTDQTPALGTLFYMAPEQADMDALPDAGWDVYGLGALLFSMLTGRPPYYTQELATEIESTDSIDQRLEVYRKTLASAPKPTAHRQVPGVDRMLADLIDRCIEPDPKHRFRNVHSVLMALKQRELAKARRPLVMLGLLLPLLLFGLVSLFGWWAFNQAIDDTKSAVIAKAEEVNRYAARLAARSTAGKVEEYLRVVRQLAKYDPFVAAYEEFDQNPAMLEVRMKIADPRKNARAGVEQHPELQAVRQALKDSPLRQKLEGFLTERMRDSDNEYPVASSWFVCDRFGNQIASVFESSIDVKTGEPDQNKNMTLGNNYAYRNYFVGTTRTESQLSEVDLDLGDPSLSNGDSLEALMGRKIISKPHLSAAFQSKQSKTWKVAFSAPIRGEKEDEILGIVAVTVDLGSLTKLDLRRDEGEDLIQYNMLVDGRKIELPVDGLKQEASGIILEHPLYKKLSDETEGGRLPDELFNGVFVDLDAAAMQHRTGAVFHDPVSKTTVGEQANYGADSIVSIYHVEVEIESSGQPSHRAEAEATGLQVLAVRDQADVLSGVWRLSSRLTWLALLALASLLATSMLMWAFVSRMMRETRERLARSFSPTSDTSGIEDMNTLLAPEAMVAPTINHDGPTGKDSKTV